MSQNTKISIAIIVVLVLVGGLVYALSHRAAPASNAPTAGVLHVVAGENFWGSIASQIGGSHAQVTSVVSDPNADPHEYSSNAGTARAFAGADYVILNGAGYDSWADKLLSASTNPNRKVLIVADLLGKRGGANPHFWYDPAYVNEVALKIETDYSTLDPQNASYYAQQYQTLQNALFGYQNQIDSLRQQFGGTKVAATEDIFVYLAMPAGLDLISPPEFMQAVAEGNDPPAQSIVTFQNQLKNQQAKLLVYNTQTVTPLTESIKKLAAAQGIPVIGISETIQPPDATFQDWMGSEIGVLKATLKTATGK